MGNKAQKVDFYFDFLSPYSYFAWINHKKLKGMSFEYRPLLMGKLFDHWGIKGPGEIAPKRHLMLKSCFRHAAKRGISFVPPQRHPFNPLYVLRLGSRACGGERQFEVIDALWDLIWGQGLAADEPEVLQSFLDNRKLAGAELMERSFSKEAKLEVKQNTKEAIERKVFGVPTFTTESDELFWGNDSLEDLERHLAGLDNYDQDLFKSRTKDIEW